MNSFFFVDQSQKYSYDNITTYSSSEIFFQRG